jgi:hypothetical protein
MTRDESMRWLGRACQEGDDPNDKATAMFAMRVGQMVTWIDAGCPILTTSHTFGSALMCTNVPKDFSADLMLPWVSFVVQVPNGLIANDERDFTRIRIGALPAGGPAVMILEDPTNSRTERMFWRIVHDGDLATLLFPHEDEDEVPVNSVHGSPVKDEDFKIRAMSLAQRLVVGLLYTMQYTTDFRERVKTSAKGAARSGPPSHRVVVIGRPLAIDCRPAVARYLGQRSRSAPPSVQSLVRGHYKRQVVGVGRGGRKVIWVEPYWRGPEDAPILARPYAVGTRSA